MQGDEDGDGVPDRLDKDYFNNRLPIGDHDGDGVLNKYDPDWKIWFHNNGDHDGDGIKNKDDQDWHDLTIRFPHWDWYIADWTPEFDDFDNFNDWWNEYEGEVDFSSTFDWSDFWGDFWGGIIDFFEDIGDWFDDRWDDFIDWWDWWSGPDCWHGGRPSGSTNAESRSNIRCEWFYVLECTDGASTWWDKIIMNTNGTGGNGDDLERLNRIQNFISKYNLDSSESDYLIELSKDCNIFSPSIEFEDCLKNKIREVEIDTHDGSTISDLSEFFKCFTDEPGSTYEVSVYTEQGKPGTSDPFGVTNGPGHTFISITQTKADGTKVVRTFGFYPDCPQGQAASLNKPNWPGAILDNGNHNYNVKTTFIGMPYSNIQSIINAVISNKNQYFDLFANNCTDYAINLLTNVGIKLPSNNSKNPFFSGRCPGLLGENLKTKYPNITTIDNSNTAKAPFAEGFCP
jgi:hypothetical protein